MKVLAGIFALVAVAFAAEDSAEVGGIENCYNKCDKVFDRTQYAISDQPDADTFEYRSCVLGCDKCSKDLKATAPKADACLKFCKTFNYKKNNIRKGIIEPDKACIVGCIIQTCQGVCAGGTTDQNITPANSKYWWGQGGPGCAIKGGNGYVQNPDYINPDSPGGEGANSQLKSCCANAFNMCHYWGDTASTNYANVVIVAKRFCKPLVGTDNQEKICEFYNEPANCGTQGMAPI